jgi:hypothetical protein
MPPGKQLMRGRSHRRDNTTMMQQTDVIEPLRHIR